MSKLVYEKSKMLNDVIDSDDKKVCDELNSFSLIWSKCTFRLCGESLSSIWSVTGNCKFYQNLLKSTSNQLSVSAQFFWVQINLKFDSLCFVLYMLVLCTKNVEHIQSWIDTSCWAIKTCGTTHLTAWYYSWCVYVFTNWRMRCSCVWV
jgi:hypothetical protein